MPLFSNDTLDKWGKISTLTESVLALGESSNPQTPSPNPREVLINWNKIYRGLSLLQEDERFIAEAFYHFARLGNLFMPSRQNATEAMQILSARCMSYVQMKLAFDAVLLREVLDILEIFKGRTTFDGPTQPPFRFKCRSKSGEIVTPKRVVELARRGHLEDFINEERYSNMSAIKGYLRSIYPDYAHDQSERRFLENKYNLPDRWFSKSDFTERRLKRFIDSVGFKPYREIIESAARQGNGLKSMMDDSETTILRLPPTYDLGPDYVYQLFRDIAEGAWGCWRIYRKNRSAPILCCRLDTLSLMSRGAQVRCKKQPVWNVAWKTGNWSTGNIGITVCDQYYAVGFEAYILPTDLYKWVDSVSYGQILTFLFSVNSELTARIYTVDSTKRARYKGLYPDLSTISNDSLPNRVNDRSRTTNVNNVTTEAQESVLRDGEMVVGDMLKHTTTNNEGAGLQYADIDVGIGSSDKGLEVSDHGHGHFVFLYVFIIVIVSFVTFLVICNYKRRAENNVVAHSRSKVDLSPLWG